MSDVGTPSGGPTTPEPASQPVPTGFGPPDKRADVRRRGLGNVVVGAILVLLGIGWLLQALDVADVPWRALLPAALIVVGIVLIFGARTGRHGGIIALGVILAVAVALASAIDILVDIPITGGVGEQIERVTGPPDAEYRWALGSMTVDLREADVSELGTPIEASVVIGELIVIVPGGTALDVEARSGMGEVDVLGDESAGIGADVDLVTEGVGGKLILDLEVAIGRVEVRR
jgi:hypothetical protein